MTDRARRIAELGERCRQALAAMLLQEGGQDGLRIPDPDTVGGAMAALAAALRARPEILLQHQTRWQAAMDELGRRQARRARGAIVEPVIEAAATDRRFKDPAWREEPLFDFLRQSYLLTAQMVRDTVAAVEGLSPHQHRIAAFYARQITDAFAPGNFILTNPMALREAALTEGESVERGLERLLADLEGGNGPFRVSTSPRNAFRLGVDLATSPGKVIVENELMQLIQYAPATARVHRRPLLIVPPWINKFYVLDLRPENSFVRHAVTQGFTVFIISWVNPGRELGHKTFADYLREGPLAALAAIEMATGEAVANLVGYCSGGTLAACALAWLAARGEPRVGAATFLATLTDFSDPGDIAVFIDDRQLALIERHMAERGYLEARVMQQVFSLLRANELIWSFVNNNYLLGREPPAFDLLHWNADGTNLPAAMHGFYLRQLYQDNRLARRDGLSLGGVPIDLGRITVPCYFLSTHDDHIAPWRSTYHGSRLFGGPVRFVLGESGHIAGVVNPPAARKYGFWTNRRRPADPEAWLATARHRPGSWWPDWAAWLRRRSGELVAARDPTAGRLPPIEDAPGRYVLVRADG